MYIVMLFSWAILLSFFIPSVIYEYQIANTDNIYILTLLTLNAFFISYFWLNGTKDIVYVVFFYVFKKRIFSYSERIKNQKKCFSNAKVLLVYCTCNDFEESSLKKCIKQSHKNTKTIILDDSDDIGYQNRIDRFACKNNIEVVRREDRKGFKAGNLNNYLRNRKDYDYFVILDSDEIIPHNFVEECLKYFKYYDNIGIVQCTHIATRNTTPFMQMFHIGVDSHWPTYQTVKHHFGFMSLLGHGAMISRQCYEATNGLPEVVAEDLCFSIEARNKGFYTAFAPNIVCQEEYPIDYIAFKKRHSKWTQGNFEFMKNYTMRILTSKMHWFEKLDIFLFTYNLPLTALFSLYIIINIALLPLIGYDLHYPIWLIVPTVVFFFAPMINDFISRFKKIAPSRLLKYMFYTFMLYGSMLYQSIKSSFLALIGKKAVFTVTPKTTSYISLFDAIAFNKEEIIFAVVMSVISLGLKGSILPVVLIVVPAVFSVVLTLYSNGDQKHSSRQPNGLRAT